MKCLAIMLLVMVAFTVTAQDQGADSLSNVPKSKIELFSDKFSRLVKEEFIDIGKSKSFELQILRITDLTDNNTQSGFRISWSKTVGTYSSRSFISFLDTDELDDLSKALGKMTTLTMGGSPSVYTEYHFKSRSGFEVSIFAQPGKPWKAGIENNRIQSAIFFNVEELSILQSGIQIAKSKL